MTKSKKIRRDPKAAHEFWLAKVTQYKSSGLNQKQFCSLRGLSVYSLRDWLQRFKKLGIDIPTSLSDSEPNKESSLVRVHLVEKKQSIDHAKGLIVEIKTKRRRNYFEWCHRCSKR